jgi:hypothetical protein
MHKRKLNKPYWTHYRIGDYSLFGFKAICGRESPMCEHSRTTTLNHVTCPRCIEELKKKYWYCPIHKFIDDVHVTNNCECKLCGSKLIQDAPQNTAEQNGHIRPTAAAQNSGS